LYIADEVQTGLMRCLEITTRPEVRALSHHIAAFFAAGSDHIRAKYPDWFTGVRQDGLVLPADPAARAR
jgi:acetylornithine/succinyldiaminopimelate/putrescine aminotransferase